MERTEQTVSWCPSGLADRPESVVLGVRSGEDGDVAYLAEPVPAHEVMSLIPEGIEPRRVLRFASHCESDCRQRVGDTCGLVTRVTAMPGPRPKMSMRASTGPWEDGNCCEVSTVRSKPRNSIFSVFPTFG